MFSIKREYRKSKHSLSFIVLLIKTFDEILIDEHNIIYYVLIYKQHSYFFFELKTAETTKFVILRICKRNIIEYVIAPIGE